MADRLADKQYLWHGVTWADGYPAVLVADLVTRQLTRIKIAGQEVGLKVEDRARYCTGRYRFADTHSVTPVPCPVQAEAVSSGQCTGCSAQDEFRFAHQFHRGSYAPPALQAYMSQPHWLYIATFTRTLSKVGTAAAPRKASRLNEQGPLCATYLAEIPDGRTVRELEDALSRELGITQTARRAAKTGALEMPDLGLVQQAHDSIADRAIAALGRWGIPPSRQEWQPPAESLVLRSPPRHGQRTAYPHNLREGEHGFRAESCLGSIALMRLTAGSEADRFIADLSVLKGFRVILGRYFTPPSMIQTSLF
jgi:hypothetical protein